MARAYACYMILVLCISLCFYIDKVTKPKPKPVAASWTTATGTVFVFDPQSATPPSKAAVSKVVTPEDERALQWAIEAWTEALGEFPIPHPLLLRSGPGGCGSDPLILACVVNHSNVIVIVDLQGDDEQTVLLHEVGHLLGVPHIIGDPLMNPNYSKTQVVPSPFAVALAKVVLEQRHTQPRYIQK